MQRFWETSAIGVALTFAVMLASCQTGRPGAVSLEEAKQTTTEFGGATAALPPRRITDVLLFLEQAPADPEKVATLQRAVAESPPDTNNAGRLAAFYYERSVAARELGLAKQALEDSKKAYEDAKKAYGPNVDYVDGRNFLTEMITNEVEFGSRRNAMELAELRLQISPDIHTRTFALAHLAANNALAGNLTAADDYFEQYKSAYQSDNNKTLWSRYWWDELHGVMYFSRGEYEQAADHFRKVLPIIPNLKNARDLAILSWGEMAESLLYAGRLLEAEVEAREAVKASVEITGSVSAITGYPITVLAATLAAQGRTDEAELLVRKTLELYERGGADPNSGYMRNSQRNLAELTAARGEWPESRRLYDQVLAWQAPLSWFERDVKQGAVYPMVLIETGSAEQARSILESSHRVRLEQLGDKHQLTAELGGVLAVALARGGEKAGALRLFQDSIPVLVSRSRDTLKAGTSQTASERTLDYILENYLKLLGEISGTELERISQIDAAAEAFKIADLARGRSVQGAINASAARAAGGDEILADLARREQNARQQIASYYALLAETEDETAANDLRERIDRLRTARGAIMSEIEQRNPQYAALINPKAPELSQVQALLRPGEALVAIYVGDGESYVWAVPETGRASFARVPMGAAEVDLLTRSMRRALDPNATTLGDIPTFDLHAAHQVYMAFLEPVAAGWRNAERLIVSSHGSLAQIPFAVLITSPVSVDEAAEPLFAGYAKLPWLIREHTVTVTPSVQAFAAQRNLPPLGTSLQQLAAFGNPVFAPGQQPGDLKDDGVESLTGRGILAVRGLPVKLRAAPQTADALSAQLAELPPLPETEDEVRAIALALSADPAQSVFVGVDASEARVKTMDLAGRRVIVFATHGLVPGDLDGLTQPALALSSPQAVGGGEDGLLTMGEILGLTLDADWVVLSACNTAAGEGAGAEAISGLGRAFFYAGARSLLVSNWPVETTSARALTSDIFARQASGALPKDEALRQSMLALLDGPGFIDAEGSAVFSYAHPIFWAPFSLVGDPG